MDHLMPVRIFGVPTACETGVTDAWREVADWTRERLTTRFGQQVTVEYYDLFSPEMDRFPEVLALVRGGDGAVPLVFVGDELLSAGDDSAQGAAAAGRAVQAQPTCTPCPPPETVVKEVEKEVVKEVPEWPWPYVELDPELARKKGHQGYYEGHCMYGAFYAILDQLREKVGFPYTQLPAEMLIYGAGGVAGWATLCGALNGAAAAINLVSDEETTMALVHELVGWYTETPFPSDQANEYAENKAYFVSEMKYDKALPPSVSGSPLCHVSVTEWCKESGYASGSPERSERCGRLAGDVAAKAVELLNEHHAGTFEPAFAMPASTETCRTCHFKGKDFEAGQFTRGKMECVDCHEPHK